MTMGTHRIAKDVSAGPAGVDAAVGVPGRKWFAAIVTSRHEKAVADKLAAHGIESYVAAQKELRVWKNGRKKQIDRVIISSIVFVRCTEQQRRQVVTFPFIFRFLVDRTADSGTLNRPVAVIPDKEMERLKFMLGQTDYHIDFEPVTYRVKDTVRVIRASLAGLVGEVAESSDGTHTLTVVIEQLGCARLKVDSKDLELI